MKYCLSLFMLLFGLQCACAQASSQTSQVYTTANGDATVIIDIPSKEYKVVASKGSRISIETSIKLSAGTTPLLDYLIKSGRYDLAFTKELNTRTITISTKKEKRVLMSKGKTCQEEILYTIYIPHHLQTNQLLSANQASN